MCKLYRGFVHSTIVPNTPNIQLLLSKYSKHLLYLQTFTDSKCSQILNLFWDNYLIFAAATIGLKELNFQPKPKE